MIYGVDPASRKIALVGFHDGKASATAFTVDKSDRNNELSHLRVQMLLTVKPQDIIFVEQPVVAGARNIQSTLRIAETVGMIYSLPARVYGVAISTWKKATVGKGNATKENVEEWLDSTHPTYSALCGGDQDLRDAAAICLYGQQAVDPHRLSSYLRGNP